MNTLSRKRRSSGFSLIELLVAMGILTIISAIAVPMYTDYIESSQRGVLLNSMATMEVFQEDFRLRNGAYAVDLANIAAITAAIGWEPNDDNGTTYVVADGDGSTYQLTATNAEGISMCRVYPARDACP